MNTPPNQQQTTIQSTYAPRVRHFPFRLVGGICICVWGIIVLFFAFYLFLTTHDRAWIGMFNSDAATQIMFQYLFALGILLLGIATIAGSGGVFWFLYSDQQRLNRGRDR